jgi:membrane-bound lytic murein transglycosylase D
MMHTISLQRLFAGVSIIFFTPFALHSEGRKEGDSLIHETRYASPSLTKADKMYINKHAKQFVKSYIRENKKKLMRIRQRSQFPFAVADSIFNKYSLPIQLKYLEVIESELKAKAVSRVGAVGPWQLMPKTARILGLQTSQAHDERTQYRKSTKAAARYLKDLYTEFGDWLLVLAAYNGGPGPVHRAIHKAGSRNFWKLQAYLPAESRNHVKKFIAALYYFEGQGGAVKTTDSVAAPIAVVRAE